MQKFNALFAAVRKIFLIIILKVLTNYEFMNNMLTAVPQGT